MSKRAFALAAWAATAVLVIAASCARGTPAADEKKPAENGPAENDAVAAVETVPLREGAIARDVVGFGTVVPGAGRTHAETVPFECRVERLLVAEGQPVRAGQPLVVVRPSAETALATEEAREEKRGAEEQLAQARERLALKLATEVDVLAASQRLRAAAVKLDNLLARGAGAERTLKASAGGVVSKSDAQAGQILAAGAPLLEIADRAGFGVRVGVEPSDAAGVRAGQRVRVEPVGRESAFTGTVGAVGGAVDPQTRLVPVLVTMHDGGAFALNSYVRARIAIGEVRGLVAPRDAVLPAGDASILFTVVNARAVRHAVEIVADDGRDVVVRGDGLAAGQAVVTRGNAELEDGMAVDTGKRP